MSKNQGGHPVDEFVHAHFTPVGEKTKAKRWNMQCNYCPANTAQIIVHRDSRCLMHLAKTEVGFCQHAPQAVREEARRKLMIKGGIAVIAGDDSDTEIVDGEVAAPASKKARTSEKGAVTTKQGLDAFLERAMTEAEKDQSNVKMMRFFIHANIPFTAAENYFALKWIHGLRPSYTPATRYVLMERYLPAEEAKVFNEDLKRLEGRNNLTYLMDGWEDSQKRSVYGCMMAEVSEFPVILGLEELTGMRATADCLINVSKRALEKKMVKPSSIIAVCTDNPTVMQAFRRKWTSEFTWIIPLACFLHGINTIIGKVISYPSAKDTISQNTRIVTFFNNSHYWGGQLDEIAAIKGVTRGLKTNTESRFYALILQALSIKDHRGALMELCSREGASRSMHGLTPVNPTVINSVFNLARWNLTDQIIRICKPLVDIIGDVESRDATLADCMLQLIWAHRAVLNTKLMPGDDPAFFQHAKSVLNTQFHAMNTDFHWLALFLHPLCRKLAVSTATHSRKLEDAYRISFEIVLRWKWTKEMAEKLAHDLKAYHNGDAPFQGGKADGKDWWKSLLVNVNDHPLKALAIKLFSIVPHAAEVERFFSSLGGVQSVKRSRLTIPHLQTFGTLRNHYIRHLHEVAKAAGKATRRKHAHMHTPAEGGGLNVGRADELLNDTLWTPQLLPVDGETSGVERADSETVTEEEIDAEFERLSEQISSAADGDGLPDNVTIDQVYDLTVLDDIRAGKIGAVSVDEELVVTSQVGGATSWDPASLLRSLGVQGQ